MTPKERLLNACLNRPVDRPPVWMMRQAGRYLPEYRVLREAHSTKHMMQTPQIACDVTLQPVHIIGVDAAIVYSDILMIPDALGQGLSFIEGHGPAFEFPIQSWDAFNRLNPSQVLERLSYVFDTVKLCSKKLGKDFPVIGFAGAPWTVACYMIAGGSKQGFGLVKSLALTDSKLFHALMDLITGITIDYLKKQIDAGACVIQLFDSWAGNLSSEDYRAWAMPYSQKIFEALNQGYVPTIHFAMNGSHLLHDLVTLPSCVISLDWRTTVTHAHSVSRGKHAFQGNLDPDILYARPAIIQERVSSMLNAIPDACRGYIANLGHGITPGVPVAHAKCFVDCVKTWKKAG